MATRPEQVPYRCDNCERVAHLHPIRQENGGTDGQARALGWRFGRTQGGEVRSYCPECSGVDENYWDDMTLDVAYMAGIDAGNTAWMGGK